MFKTARSNLRECLFAVSIDAALNRQTQSRAGSIQRAEPETDLVAQLPLDVIEFEEEALQGASKRGRRQAG